MQRERIDVTLLPEWMRMQPGCSAAVLGERRAICPFLPLTQHKTHSKAASVTLEEGRITQGFSRLKLEGLKNKDARAEHFSKLSIVQSSSSDHEKARVPTSTHRADNNRR